MSTIAVVGGGIAGLTAAFALGGEHDVVVFEPEPVAGGKIRSQPLDGFLFESGPSGFLSNAEDLRALVTELGLDDAVVQAQPAAKNRYIFWNGQLHKLPAKPPEIFSMSLLSPLGKLRAAGDLFVPRRSVKNALEDESVYGFMARRFGREVAERIATPALLGISGGDAATTSLAAVMPRVAALERERGSVIRGMIKGARTAARMQSFTGGGMQRLTDRLAERLGSRLRLGTAVERIERQGEGWRLVYAGGETAADRVVVAAPADVAARLVAGFDEELAAQLRRITYAPMRVIGVGFRASDVPALDGFGFLAARGAGVRVLGAIYASTIVPEQAPDGAVYLRIFMGGAADPAAAALDAAQARAVVLGDLATALGITAEPIAYHEVVWPLAIPQYSLAHTGRVRAIEARTAAHPGFALTGNAYRGLGVGDAVADARATAARIASWKP